VGQKVSPIAFRLGFFRGWSARWYCSKKDYGDKVLQDLKIRKFIASEVTAANVDSVEIDRTGDSPRVIINAGKPGMVIGKKGKGIELLRASMAKNIGSAVDVSVKEVRVPDLSAQILATSIAKQMEARSSFRRVMKRSGFAAIKAGAKGIKICCGGRLGGAEIARKEWFRHGSVPLHTLRAEIDFATAEAHTTYGIVGVKVWICKS
jgi:small subunit ribosomal protein S3